jgi:hypothetical protein
MQPFWITIQPYHEPTPLNLGAGITAHSEDDARALFISAFGMEVKIRSVEPIADMRLLEQRHVAPNMGNFLKRGVWFPLGYDQM